MNGEGKTKLEHMEITKRCKLEIEEIREFGEMDPERFAYLLNQVNIHVRAQFDIPVYIYTCI